MIKNQTIIQMRMQFVDHTHRDVVGIDHTLDITGINWSDRKRASRNFFGHVIAMQAKLNKAITQREEDRANGLIPDPEMSVDAQAAALREGAQSTEEVASE